VDGFDQDKHKGQRDERGIVLLGFLAPHGHPLEALGLADQLLGASPQLVKPLWEEPRLALDIGPVRNDRRYPAFLTRLDWPRADFLIFPLKSIRYGIFGMIGAKTVCFSS
jgi:hypothetical protein